MNRVLNKRMRGLYHGRRDRRRRGAGLHTKRTGTCPGAAPGDAVLGAAAVPVLGERPESSHAAEIIVIRVFILLRGFRRRPFRGLGHGYVPRKSPNKRNWGGGKGHDGEAGGRRRSSPEKRNDMRVGGKYREIILTRAEYLSYM